MEVVLVLLILLLASGNSASFSNNPPEPKSLVFQSSERFISTTNYVWHMELDQHKNDGSILFADSSALKTVTKDKSITAVVSGFSRLTGFEQLNSTHLAVVDRDTHCVKMVNRVNNSVRVLAGQCGNRGLSDGNPGQFYHPRAAEEDVWHAGKLLITDTYNHALRSVDVNSGVISTVISSGFNYPIGMAWNKDRLLVTNIHYISEVVWSDDDTVTNTLLAGSTSTGSADGDFTTSRFYYPYYISSITSSWFLIADVSNKKLRLLDVTRREVLPVCTNSLSPCTESTDLGYRPWSVLQTADAVYVGGRRQITKFTAVSARYNTSCAQSISREASSDTKTALLTVPSQGFGYQLELPIGKHPLNIPYASATCNVTVIVFDPNIRRRVTFQADYDVECDQGMAAVSKNIMTTSAQKHFEEINEICGRTCKPIANRKPIITCLNDKLRIQWPTNPAYSADVTDIKPETKSALKQRVSRRQISTFSLVVPSKIPPVVFPVRNSDGDLLTFSLTSYCVDGSTYDVQTDRCQ